MAQIFRPRFVLLVKLISCLILVLAFALVMVWRGSIAQVPSLDAPVEQLPPFSHKHHVSDVGLDCRFCHTSVEFSAFAGIPPTSTCMTCHSQIFRDQKILGPVFVSFQKNESLRWIRVHKLPDFVYFNHSIHVAKGVGCSTCHGQVDQMALIWRTQSLDMDWCVNCHQGPENFVRPRELVFDMNWRPPSDQVAIGKQLLVKYQVDARRLLDCSNCHR